MSAIGAMIHGIGRVLSAPLLVVWLWLTNLIVALPAAAVMTAALSSSIGASEVDQSLRDGFDMGWYGEFSAQAKGLEETFTPTVVGAGAFLDNIEAWFNGELFSGFPGLVGLGLLYALLWALFLGGIFDRCSDRSGLFSLKTFFSRGGKFFLRYLRLAVFSGLLYYAIYQISGSLFGWIEEATRDVTEEAVVFRYVLLAAALVLFLLTFVNMAFDYAKIATFRENRRSMVLAALTGFGFVLSHPGKCFFLYYALGVLSLLMLGLYYLIAPGAGQSTVAGVVFAFAVGQAYLVAKLVLRLTFYASELVLYESTI